MGCVLVLISAQTTTGSNAAHWWQVVPAVAAAVSAIVAAINTFYARQAANASRQTGADAMEALAMGIRPALHLRSVIEVEAGHPTALALSVVNGSRWPPTDTEVEIRYHSGFSSVHEWGSEAVFQVPIDAQRATIDRTSTDLWHQYRENIAEVVLTYSDERGIATYEQRILPNPSPSALPFDSSTAEERWWVGRDPKVSKAAHWSRNA